MRSVREPSLEFIRRAEDLKTLECQSDIADHNITNMDVLCGTWMIGVQIVQQEDLEVLIQRIQKYSVVPIYIRVGSGTRL